MIKNFTQLGIEGPEKIATFCSSDGLSLQALFFAIYHKFPSLYTFRNTAEAFSNYFFDVKEILNELKEKYGENNIQLVTYTVFEIQNKKETTGINVYISNRDLFARIEERPDDSYILYPNSREEDVKELIEVILKSHKKPELPPNNNKNYNDDFVAESKKIIEFIKRDDDSGLLILHGDKGTGKSTYIRHLISINPEKKFVYISANLVSILSEPSFSAFLMTLQNHIIILEDCEEAIKDRKTNGTSAAVSLLLNLTDGLLSDGLGLKFICTFNDDVKNIDDALLRKGRCVSKYEFKNLCLEKTNVLLSELYKEAWENGEYEREPITDKPLSLANIYKFYDKSYEKERKNLI